METRICGNLDCQIEFEPKTHNQRYCKDECCKIATNRRIMEKYYEKKARRRGGKRVCSNPKCETVLSRYNDSSICSGCSSKKVSIEMNLIRVTVSGGTW